MLKAQIITGLTISDLMIHTGIKTDGLGVRDSSKKASAVTISDLTNINV